MNHRAYVVAVVLLSATAIAQAIPTLNPPAAAGGEESYLNLPLGSRVESVVLSGGQHGPLSDTYPGQCRLIVIYSRSCGASQVAAKLWAREAIAGARLPEGYRTIWVAVEGRELVSTGFFPPGFPAEQGWYASGPRLEAALGMRVYPVSILLDKDGRAAWASAGAAYPSPDTFRPDCTTTLPWGTQPPRRGSPRS